VSASQSRVRLKKRADSPITTTPNKATGHRPQRRPEIGPTAALEKNAPHGDVDERVLKACPRRLDTPVFSGRAGHGA
jgi:hypothetical protein